MFLFCCLGFACCLVNNGGVVVWCGLVCLFGFVVLVACRLLFGVRGLCLLRCAWFGSGGAFVGACLFVGCVSVGCVW